MKNRRVLIFISIVFILSILLCACSERAPLAEITVTFNTDGGSNVSSVTDKTISTAPISKKTGYLLEGWYFDTKYENRVEFPFLAGSTCTLYAKWTSLSKGNDNTEYALTDNGYEVTKLDKESISLIIPDTYNNKPVIGIKERSLINAYRNLKFLYIGKNVTYINQDFHTCLDLEEVMVSSDNDNFLVEDGVLYNNEKLILYPNAKKEEVFTLSKPFSDTAFGNTLNLKKLILDSGVSITGDEDFSVITSLQEFEVKQGLGNLFSDNGNLYLRIDNGIKLLSRPVSSTNSTLRIVDNVTSVSKDALSIANNLEEIILGDNFTATDFVDALLDASSLEKITVNNSDIFSTKDGILYNVDKTELYFFPASKTVEGGIFTIPEGVTNLGAFSFYANKTLDEIILPKTIESISSYAFSYADRLTKVTQKEDSNLVSIGDGAFSSCKKLEAVEVVNKIPPILGEYVFYGSTLAKVVIPDNTLAIYKHFWKESSINFSPTGKASPTFTVTFDLQGGEDLKDHNLIFESNSLHGVLVEKEPYTEKDGFVFVGWYLNTQGTGERITFPYIITDHVTLYAVWDIPIE